MRGMGRWIALYNLLRPHALGGITPAMLGTGLFEGCLIREKAHLVTAKTCPYKGDHHYPGIAYPVIATTFQTFIALSASDNTVFYSF
jgi:hypothetical protein